MHEYLEVHGTIFQSACNWARRWSCGCGAAFSARRITTSLSTRSTPPSTVCDGELQQARLRLRARRVQPQQHLRTRPTQGLPPSSCSPSRLGQPRQRLSDVEEGDSGPAAAMPPQQRPMLTRANMRRVARTSTGPLHASHPGGRGQPALPPTSLDRTAPIRCPRDCTGPRTRGRAARRDCGGRGGRGGCGGEWAASASASGCGRGSYGLG